MPVQNGIIGRDQERARIEAFLDQARPSSLLIDGEAGIGKSTLWTFGVAQARARGARVMSWRASAAEQDLAFSVLIGMLDEPDVGTSLETLPDPRRQALAVALGMADAAGRPPEPHLVGMAVVDVMRRLAGDGPMVIGVDDLQWCDRASQEALAFAVRRLRAEPLALLLARRTTRGDGPPELVDGMPPDRRGRLEVGPLTIGALGRLIHDRLGISHPRPLLVRLHDATRGNPFLALEVSRTLIARGFEPAPGEPFPVPAEAAPLVRDRLSVLSPGAREALLVVAISSHPTLGLLERVLGPDAGRAIDEAYRADVVVAEGDRLRPSHPLLGSIAYADAPPGERRRLHMALAVAADDPVERALHLAGSAEGSDEEVAGAVAAAARVALGRGAPGPAAVLFERAAGLSNGEEVRGRHHIDAAASFLRAGDAGRAEAILRGVLGEVPRGPLRAAALLDLAEIVDLERPDEGRALLREALEHSEGDPRLEASVHWHLGGQAGGDPNVLRTSVNAALELMQRPGVRPDPDELAHALMGRAYLMVAQAERIAQEDVDRAGLMFSGRTDTWVGRRFVWAQMGWAFQTDRLEEARKLLLAEHERRSDLGQVGLLPETLQHLVKCELLLGDWPSALRHVDELEELVQEGVEPWHDYLAICRARVLAARGDLNEARAVAQEGLRRQENDGDVWEATIFSAILGFIELSVPDPPRALAHLLRTAQLEAQSAVVLPTIFRYQGDLVEAAALAGDLDRAERELIDRLEGPAKGVPLPWILAVAARGRGLIAAARAETDDSLGWLDRSLEVLDGAAPMPLERGRTLLVRGSVHRRAGHRRTARNDLEGALAIFQGLGAKAWARRAEEALSAIGGRRRSAFDLTTSERRVAELASSGLSNREIAAELFVSIRTVENQLSAAYRKLGVPSRARLASVLAAQKERAAP